MYWHLNMFCIYSLCADSVNSSLVWEGAQMGKAECSPKMFVVVLFV